MSDTSQEPTMEEILASIRRIISEDDAPAAEPAAAAAPAPAPVPEELAPAPAPASFDDPDDDVLELTQKVEAPEPFDLDGPAHPFLDDIIPSSEPEPPPPPKPVRAAPAPVPPATASLLDEDALLSQATSAAASSHFGALSQTIFMPGEGRTLEDVVKELLRPLLKDWLDTHLTTIVESRVQAEVERISRRRVY